MNVGLISSSDYFASIKEALQEHLILFEKIGTFSPEEFDHHCTAAIHIPLELLIVDMTCCSSDEAIIKGLRKYRIAKSSRVILIAPGRQPGDLTISKIVAEGIYDILAPELPEEDVVSSSFDIVLDLQKTVNQDPHYGVAARWRVYHDEDTEHSKIKFPEIDFSKIKDAVFSKKKKSVISGSTVPIEDDFDLFDDDLFITQQNRPDILEKIVGTVTIAVFSGLRRTGCSFSAIQIAHWLSQKYRTAYVEMEQSTSDFFRTIESEKKPSPFTVGKLTLYPGKSEIEELLFEDWEYVVIDFGTHWRKHLTSFARSHLHILTAYGGDMEANADLLSDLFDRNWKRPIHFVITATEKGFKEWKEAVSRKEQKELHLHFWKQTLMDDPFQDAVLPIQEILKSVLPSKKRGLFHFFRSRG